jgi:ABC-type transport system involved in multi-copper enzyme maturation permease subunit
MKGIRSWVTPNPILVKELRSRMRGPRAFITLTIALLIMSGLMIALVSLLTNAASQFGSSLLSPQIGQILFAALLIFEMLLVCTITPAVTAGAISTEREKQTFEMLQATPLGSVRLLWGKLISAMSYVFLLIFAAVPLASIVFLFGGVALVQLLKGLLVLVAAAITLGVYGLFLSAWLGRTGRATVVGFISVMVLIVGPLAATIIMSIFGARLVFPRFLLAISPISMLSSAITTTSSNNSSGVDGVLNFIAGQWNPSMDPTALTQFPRPLYHYSLLFCGLLTIILFVLTVALLHPSRRFFLSRRVGLIGGAVLLFFLSVMTAAFLFTAPHYEWVKGAIETPMPQAAVAVPAKGMPPQPVEAYPAGAATPTPANLPAYPAGEGPTPTPTVVTAWGAAMPLEDQVAIYAAAARRIYQKDNTMDASAPRFPVVYLVSITNDRVGDPKQPDAGPISLDPDLRKGIAAAMSDLPARIIWSLTLDEIPKDSKSGAIQGDGMAITFGNIQIQPDGRVQLPASVYIASMMAGGQTYVLEKVNGEWQITGTTGTQWIS